MVATSSQGNVEMDPSRTPAVVVDDVQVVYRVYASGKRASGAAKGKGAGGLARLVKLARRKSSNKKAAPKRGKGLGRSNLREVHAVKGVSFVVYEGESVGIVGSNGSGKSSLMRVIAGLTQPTSGAVYAAARPTFLGVGAAMLPNLSGEKNILLGGMALGFSKREIEAKVPEVAEFAGLEEFIDLPMNTYSSGMSARLRFSIAAAKKHEILIVDEALAVGDRQFRKRSEARMRDMRDDAGTVFLVSHSMKSILDTCTRVIWLEKGELLMDGDPQTVVDAYTQAMDEGKE